MKTVPRQKLILLAVLALLLAASIAVLVLQTPYAIIINGARDLTIALNQPYQDAGAHVVFNAGTVITEGSVDSSVLGDYQISYHYNGFTRTRTVHVCDQTSPVLSLKGHDAYICLNGSYEEYGYTAVDNVDGNIEDCVSIVSNVDTAKPGVYQIKYQVSDKAGNSAAAVRSVTVSSRDILNEEVSQFNLDGLFTDTIIQSDEQLAADCFVLAGDETIGGLAYHGVISLDENLWTKTQLTPASIGASKMNVAGQPAQTFYELLADRKPSLVFLLIGTSETADCSTDEFIQEYEKVIAPMKEASPDTVFVVLSMLPVSAEADNNALNKKINSINYFLCQLCAKYEIRFFDAARLLKSSDGALAPAYQTADGIHINSTADLVIVNRIKEIVSE